MHIAKADLRLPRFTVARQDSVVMRIWPAESRDMRPTRDSGKVLPAAHRHRFIRGQLDARFDVASRACRAAQHVFPWSMPAAHLRLRQRQLLVRAGP